MVKGDDILSKTIYSYADSLSQLLPVGSTVFINDHSDFNGVISYFGKYVAVKISNRLTKNKNFNVVDRNSIELILKEQKFQYSGVVDEKTAVELGKMVGASVIVFGTITEFTNKVSIDSKILSVQTAKVIGTTDYSINKTKDVADLIATVISSSEQQKKELETERQKILKQIDLERENKLAGLELEERQLKQKIINLETEYREKSVVLKEYKVQQEKLRKIENEIEKIHREIDNASNKIRLLKIGMTKDEVWEILGKRARQSESPYDCLYVGKYILVFKGKTLMKGCIMGDSTNPGGIGNIIDDCSSCQHFDTINRIRY
jgi:TolB-like protein